MLKVCVCTTSRCRPSSYKKLNAEELFYGSVVRCHSACIDRLACMCYFAAIDMVNKTIYNPLHAVELQARFGFGWIATTSR